jgi:hypothetical protein
LRNAMMTYSILNKCQLMGQNSLCVQLRPVTSSQSKAKAKVVPPHAMKVLGEEEV